MSEKTDRRSFLNRTLLAGSAGLGIACSLEEKILLAALQEEVSRGEPNEPKLDPNDMPSGKIGDVKISRFFLGGNLIGGHAHSRDLLYVSKLFKAYNTEAKIFETLELAQACGINTILIDPRDWSCVIKYNRARSNKIQTMLSVALVAEKLKMRDEVKRLVDKGATLLYPHGGQCDEAVMTGQLEVIAQAVDLIKAEGIPAGIGSHSLQVPIAAEKNHLNPDFYVKTFHSDRYWSATPKEGRKEWCWQKASTSDHDGYHDNMFCLDPEEAAAFMESVEKPWVAFKVMAAGAIPPRTAFSFAYRHGADFVVAGMFDFQVEQDVRFAVEILKQLGSRKRPWRG